MKSGSFSSLLGFWKNWTQRFFGFENFQKKSKPDSSIPKSVIFLGGKKSSKCNTHSIFWQKSLLPLFFKTKSSNLACFWGNVSSQVCLLAAFLMVLCHSVSN
jgi:hypothetical protein